MRSMLVLLVSFALLMPLVSATGAGAYLAADPTKGYTKSITLGMVATLDNSTIGIISGQPAVAALFAAVKVINARSDILRTTGLNVIVNDTGGDQGQTVKNILYQFETYGISGIVGESESDTALAASFVSKFYNIPEVSWAATDSIFNDYQWFYRTIGAIIPQSSTLADALYAIGWRRVAYVTGTSSLDIQAAGAFKSRALHLGMTIVGTQVFENGQTDPMFQLNALVSSRAHIIGLFGSAAELTPLMKTAYTMGLYGNLYQYFSFWTLMDSSTWIDPSTGVFKSDVYAICNNMIGIVPFVDRTSPSFSNFSQAYLASNAPPSAVNPLFPSVYNQPPNLRAALAYDAIFTLVNGLDIVIEKQGHSLPLNTSSYDPATGPLYDALNELSFAGATGQVLFDVDGSRICQYSIVQMQDGAFVQAATTVYTTNPVAGAAAPTSTVVFISPSSATKGFRFPGNAIMLDDDARVEQTVGVGYLIAAVIIAFFGVGINAFILFLIKKNLEKPIVKASSVPFSVMLNVGVMIGWLSLISTAMDKGSSSQSGWQFSCQAQIWLLSLSWSLIFVSLLAKAWRYGRIFSITGLNTVKLSDAHLLRAAFVLIAIDFIICLVWALVYPLQPQFTALDAITYTPICVSSNMWTIGIIKLAYLGILALYTLYCAYQIRMYNEGKSMLVSVGVMVILAALAVPFSQILNSLGASHAVMAIAIILGLLAVNNVTFGPFVFLTLFEPYNLDVIPNTEMARSAAST